MLGGEKRGGRQNEDSREERIKAFADSIIRDELSKNRWAAGRMETDIIEKRLNGGVGGRGKKVKRLKRKEGREGRGEQLTIDKEGGNVLRRKCWSWESGRQKFAFYSLLNNRGVGQGTKGTEQTCYQI